MAEMPCIGILDSGVGGLGVLGEALRLFSGARFYYFADREHAPYGSMGENELKKCVLSGLEMFEKRGVCAAALACNTATAVCAEEMRRRFAFPVIGTEPAVRPAVRAGCKNVLVLVTPRTRDTARFRALLARERGNFTVFAPPRLASAIEAYAAGGPPPTLSDHLPAGRFDGVVLGCTHYALLGEEISRFYSAPVFDGNGGTARRLYACAGRGAAGAFRADTGRDGSPRVGMDDHQKGAVTTSERFPSLCELSTKNEIIFLYSTKNDSKICYEQTFFKQMMAKNAAIGRIGEKFF